MDAIYVLALIALYVLTYGLARVIARLEGRL